MKKLFAIFLFACLSFPPVHAQGINKFPDGGGEVRFNAMDSMTKNEKDFIISELKKSELLLRQQGKLSSINNPTVTTFAWPLKQANGFNDNGFYGISNYVDENSAYPNQLRDYNCGTRTYDLSNGYNHAGTDIFLWPGMWQKMQRNAVQIIAAAPGTILYKSDGNTDQNCAFCTTTCNWNAVYIMHADGTVAWYGHMKSGSLTTKSVGQTVALGEFLGIVGSSGNSTGPHLHFEVYTNSSYTQLVDPWNGPCNTMNPGVSWWTNQQNYQVPTLNKLITNKTAPSLGSCPNQEFINETNTFSNGDTLFLSSYYRDQLSGQSSVHKIYKPDGSVWQTWNQNFTNNYSASYWYYYWILPNPAPSGVWKYEVVFNGTQKESVFFSVNDAVLRVCPNNYYVINSNITGSTYQWQVNTGSGFVNITNGVNYSGVNTSKLLLNNLPSTFYGYQYRCLVNGTSPGKTLTLQFVSYWNGRTGKNWEDVSNWTCGNIPDSNTDVVIPLNTNTPDVNQNTVCRTLNVQSGAKLSVKPGVQLKVLK